MIEVDKILNSMKEDLTNLRILENLIDMKVEDLIDGLKSGRLQIATFKKINLSNEIRNILKTKKCENCQSWATGTNFLNDRCGLFGKKVTYNANTCKHYQERKFENE